jgi:hypothetical protein
MKIAIMQPYFFPYLGYFQLINAVDRFYLYDDANFISRGWVNRNRVLLAGKPHWFTLPLVRASQNRKINEHCVARDRNFGKLEAILKHAYGRAPLFEQVFPLLCRLLQDEENNLAVLLKNTLLAVSEYLGVSKPILLTSDMGIPEEAKGQNRILDICSSAGASSYLNPIGGRQLYDHDTFAKRGIELIFLKSRPVIYQQYAREFQPYLSIIDLMMFNDPSTIQNMLDAYDLT